MSTARTALIIVDVQPDFLPGGNLAVPDGDAVIPVINAAQPRFDLVVATQDWHPAGHESFASQHPGHGIGEVIDLHGLPQVLWPDHCIQGTPGAELAAGLDTARLAHVVQKGTDPRVDSYSGFFDNGHRHDTGLAAWLRDAGVTDITVAGLATDYCVKFTALDAVEQGFTTRLLLAGCRGVNLSPGDVEAAVAAMRAAGVAIIEPR